MIARLVHRLFTTWTIEFSLAVGLPDSRPNAATPAMLTAGPIEIRRRRLEIAARESARAFRARCAVQHEHVAAAATA